LETKRVFVRYVSHEIRTPLNSACLGLQLLQTEIQKCSLDRIVTTAQQIVQLGVINSNNVSSLPINTYISPQESSGIRINSYNSNNNNSNSHLPATLPANLSLTSCTTVMKDNWLELIADTYQACNIAVDILNDLLMYEKIDGGLMALDVSEVSLWPLMDEALKMFNTQAKALGITLNYQQKRLPMDVFLTVDSYKISQVFRNLMSNALKFALVGQEVVIDAEFIPASSKLHDYFTKMAHVASVATSPTDFRKNRVYISNENNIADLKGDGISSSNSNTKSNSNNKEDLMLFENIEMQKQEDDHCNIITAAQHEQHDIENNLPPRGRENRSSVTSLTSVAPSVLSPPNLLDIGNHHYYEIDMIRIAVTDFGVGISKVIILHYHFSNFSLISFFFASIDRRIKSACSMKLCNSMQPSCSKGKGLA